jgi:predicted glycoside hydrolase/deacetylase ChbG (UPF0249 family)
VGLQQGEARAREPFPQLSAMNPTVVHPKARTAYSAESDRQLFPAGESAGRKPDSKALEQGSGMLVINADDWGRDQQTTDAIREFTRTGAVSSVSAMVFMEDSERAAAIARQDGTFAGLHLNLTTPFSFRGCRVGLRSHQERLARYLTRSRFSRLIFHPGLANSFRYVVSAQLDEFHRLYDSGARKIDGHHHMHLSANILFAGLLPHDVIVRRHFSSEPGEKRLRNVAFRQFTRVLMTGHRTTDYFFSLVPLEPEERLKRIFGLARTSCVELGVHPIQSRETVFLRHEIQHWTDGLRMASFGQVAEIRAGTGME